MGKRYRATARYLTGLGMVSVIGLAIGGSILIGLAIKAYAPIPSAVQGLER